MTAVFFAVIGLFTFYRKISLKTNKFYGVLYNSLIVSVIAISLIRFAGAYTAATHASAKITVTISIGWNGIFQLPPKCVLLRRYRMMHAESAFHFDYTGICRMGNSSTCLINTRYCRHRYLSLHRQPSET